jgi:hypothetical protein
VADGEAAQGIGMQPRQRELLGLLLALMSSALLLVVVANARAVGGFGSAPGSLTIDMGSTASLDSTLKFIALSQTPTQALLLVGAVALVGSGPWGGVSLAARIARVVVLVVGVLVGVSAAYGALLVGPLGEENLAYGGGTALDGRVGVGLLALAISASGLVVARMAFGLLPAGEPAGGATDRAGSEREPVESPPR